MQDKYLLGWDLIESLFEFMRTRHGVTGPLWLTSNQVVGAQYLADFEDDQKADDIIVRYSRLFNKKEREHSHSEIGFWINGYLVFYSATSRDYLGGKNGTRWIAAEDMLKHPERWDLYANDGYSSPEVKDMIFRADNECGKPYDWTGIAGFASPVDLTGARVWLRELRGLDKLPKWYCSRVAHYVETGEIVRMTPMRRAQWMRKNKNWKPARYIHHRILEGT